MPPTVQSVLEEQSLNVQNVYSTLINKMMAAVHGYYNHVQSDVKIVPTPTIVSNVIKDTSVPQFLDVINVHLTVINVMMLIPVLIVKKVST